MATAHLQAEDRQFFGAVGRVVFENPFSPERARLIVQLAPEATLGDLTHDREALARIVESRLRPMLSAGGRPLERYGDEDRRTLEPAFLYVSYHRNVARLDELIERQAIRSGTPPPVPFADEGIQELATYGFDEARAVRYFALFYQRRRAFYFIHRSFAGECESMRRLRHALWNNVLTHDMRGYEAGLWSRMEDFSTLLLGETGTGKGAAAGGIGPVIGLILIGLNLARMRTGVPVSGFTTAICFVSLIWGGLELASPVLNLSFEIPVFALLLIVFGVLVMGNAVTRRSAAH